MADEAVEQALGKIEDTELRGALTTIFEGQKTTYEANFSEFQSKSDGTISDLTKANRDFEVEIAGLKEAAVKGTSNVELSETQKDIAERHKREDSEKATATEIEGYKTTIASYEGAAVEASKTQYLAEGMPKDLVDLIETPKDAKAYYTIWKTSGGGSDNLGGGDRSGSPGTGTQRSTGSNNSNLTENERISREMNVYFPNKNS